MSNRPNILIFNPDSYRGDVLHHLGNTGAFTPSLDAMLKNGAVSYANAFAQNPVCTPSRCSFMTGWYPHTCGHRSMKNMLKPYEPNLLSVLRREGYFVWWGGKNDLFAVEKPEDYLNYCDSKYTPEQAAVSECHVPPPVSLDDRRYRLFYRGVGTRDGDGPLMRSRDKAIALGAADFIRSAPADQPFCAFISLNMPHPAYQVEEDFYNLIDPDKLPLRLPVPECSLPLLDSLREGYRAAGIGEDDWKEIKRIYYAMCATVDSYFGIVINALKQAGLYDDTLIFFMSDHGDFAGDYSLPEKSHGSLQDCLLRSPLVVKPPEGVAVTPGIRNHLCELVDMTATIYDLCVIEPGYDSFGKSLRDSLGGSDAENREAVFAEVGSREGETQFKNKDVLKRDPESFYGVQGKYALAAHDAGTYAISCRTQRWKYIRRGYFDFHELYDLEKDPGEMVNLHGNPAYAEPEQIIEKLLLNHFMTTADVMPHKQDSRSV